VRTCSSPAAARRELDGAAREIGATAVVADVAKLDDLDRLFASIRDSRGRLDIVFANAAIAEGAPLAEVTEDHFDVNVKGALFTVQKALPLLVDGASILMYVETQTLYVRP
jgi:NAD(P)-dependent dehydrogenase (short-subunit alcohol dehydrogenase family)